MELNALHEKVERATQISMCAARTAKSEPLNKR